MWAKRDVDIRSQEARDNSNRLFLLEQRDGTRVLSDGIRIFAKEKGVDAGNLYNTIKDGKRKWAGDWRLIEIFDLNCPDYQKIIKVVDICKTPDRRILLRLINIKKGLI